jgi:L-2,4-diaminobutyrate transaminase
LGVRQEVEFVANKESRPFHDVGDKIEPQISAKLLDQNSVIVRAIDKVPSDAGYRSSF